MWMAAAFGYNRSVVVAGARPRADSRTAFGLYILVIATALLVGLRFEIGADWFNYLDNYNLVQFLTYGQALQTFDVGYVTLVFVASHLDAGMWPVNLACGIIMMLGIGRFCSRQQNPALTFLVAIPYLIIVVGMGYTRQGVAIGIVLAGLADADGRSPVKLILFILAAALFHRTALLVLPLALAPLARRNMLQAILGALVSLGLFAVLLSRSTDQLVATYITQDYESGGAVVRVAMNIVPAMLALLLRNRLGFNDYQRDMWSIFALVALATLPLVLATSFTTAIDRVALFLIPLQLAILPRLPYALGSSRQNNAQLLLGVCGYSAAVQLVWLVFATHAAYWVPYKNVVFGA
ncbi:EpsG family protein [Sphingomonas gellani]|uniref:EpsG family protein n=1 Tax=Sphingomonas gellani TaxID=1166340 RepID=A0A1H8I3Z8_9SPHN|nr:EpsG family protein [Sphingomonas gellani]SEN62756.1 EpsG family protein [Sphingomonas gellani]